MIDQDVFNIEWAVICERFNRDPSQVLAARYYQSLSPRMTTEQFRASARVVFEQREFFPRPLDFVEAIRPSVEAEALEQWELCEGVMAGLRKALVRMSPAGKRTVGLLGGPDRLRNTKLDQVPFVRRDFLKLFGDAEEIHRRETEPTALPVSDETKELLASMVPRLMNGESAPPPSPLDIVNDRARRERWYAIRDELEATGMDAETAAEKGLEMLRAEL